MTKKEFIKLFSNKKVKVKKENIESIIDMIFKYKFNLIGEKKEDYLHAFKMQEEPFATGFIFGKNKCLGLLNDTWVHNFEY